MDYSKIVSDKEAEFNNLFSRMDKDKDLLILKSFSLVDKDSKTAPEVDNITLNDPQTFFNQVQSNLIAANMQTVVEGDKLKDKETTFVEDFIQDIELAIESRLQARGIPSLRLFNIQQILGRGRVASRICLRMDGDEFVPDVLPLDARYLIYDVGINGLKWAAYKTTRTKAQVEDEYGLEVKQSNPVIIDFWDDEVEVVLAGREVIREQKHPYKCVPFIIQLSPTGLFYEDEDRFQYMGESIFAADRELYEAKNKMGSILMTITMGSFYAGLQYESEAGTQAQKPERPPYGKRFVVPVEKGAGYKLMPVRDIGNATRWLYQMIDSALQRGSLPAVSYGNLTFPLSAVAITSLTEAEDPVYLPRMQGLALFYQRLYRMLIDQYVEQKMKVKLGDLGFQKEYPFGELDKDYAIKFKFFSTSPKQNIANYQIAASARQFVSDDTIRRDILQLENPDKELAKRLSEMADQMVPTLALYKMAKAKIDEGDDIGAQLIANQLGITLQQLASGKLAEKPKEAAQPEKPLLPLMEGEGGMVRPGVSSAKRAAQLGTEQEVEE